MHLVDSSIENIKKIYNLVFQKNILTALLAQGVVGASADPDDCDYWGSRFE